MSNPEKYLAHKINGPIAKSLLQAQDNGYAQAKDWFEYRNTVSAKTATTEDLNMLGTIVGAQRPYAVIDGQITYASDEVYRRFLLNVATLRRNKSIFALATMLNQFIETGLYDIEIQSNGDITVVIDTAYQAYAPFLSVALNSLFTALPRIDALIIRDYDTFIFDNGLYYYFILLKDPGVWTWEYDDTNHKLITTSTDPSSIAITQDPDGRCHVSLSVAQE